MIVKRCFECGAVGDNVVIYMDLTTERPGDSKIPLCDACILERIKSIEAKTPEEPMG